MAKIPIDKLPQELKKQLEYAIAEVTSISSMKEIGDTLTEEIYRRTKLGYGVQDSGGQQSKLKPLTDSYKKQRKYKPLAPDTTLSKSNLTQTGEMLDDLSCKASDSKVTIGFNTDLSLKKAGWQVEQGRTFLNVTGTQINNLKTLIKNKLKEILSRD